MKTTKTCATCTRKLMGRKDKVFCSKKCQNIHHAIARICTTNIQKKKYSKRIKRNYVVLKGVLSANTAVVLINKNNLFKLGFDQSFFLKRKKRKGKYIYLIKEFEFWDAGNGKIQIKRTEKGSPYFKEFIARWNKECPTEEVGALYYERDGVAFYFKRIVFYLNNCLVDKSAISVLRSLKTTSQ